jgi:CheY-like chemotaxis protein
MPSSDDHDHAALRDAHSRAAVLRTLATELEREARTGTDTGGLQAQVVEESARLVSALEELSRVRSSAPPSLRDPGAASGAGRRWRVLLVEDDDETRAAISQGLSDRYEVITARDGVEGLRALADGAVDAIVTDLRMPGMDGLAMVERIRAMEAAARTPVVYLSAETEPERVAATFSTGATSYMVKPVDLELLDAELTWALATPAP